MPLDKVRRDLLHVLRRGVLQHVVLPSVRHLRKRAGAGRRPQGGGTRVVWLLLTIDHSSSLLSRSRRPEYDGSWSQKPGTFSGSERTIMIEGENYCDWAAC